MVKFLLAQCWLVITSSPLHTVAIVKGFRGSHPDAVVMRQRSRRLEAWKENLKGVEYEYRKFGS